MDASCNASLPSPGNLCFEDGSLSAEEQQELLDAAPRTEDIVDGVASREKIAELLTKMVPVTANSVI
jgi:hypothetical protein